MSAAHEPLQAQRLDLPSHKSPVMGQSDSSLSSQSLTGNSSGLCLFLAHPCQWFLWLPAAHFGQMWHAQTVSGDRRKIKWKEFEYLNALKIEFSLVLAVGVVLQVWLSFSTVIYAQCLDTGVLDTIFMTTTNNNSKSKQIVKWNNRNLKAET